MSELDRIDSSFAETERIVDSLELLLGAATSAEKENLVLLARGLRNAVYRSAIATFISSIDAMHQAGSFSDVEYAQISPILEKWHAPSDEEFLSDSSFEEFKADVGEFSERYPNWYKDGVSALAWFTDRIWNGIFAARLERANQLTKKIDALLDCGLQNIRALVESDFARLTPFEFEHLIAQLFTRMGYDCRVTSASGDYGVDVVARRGNERIAIQVKRYAPHNRVGNREVQRLLGAMQFESFGATKAILVTTSDFTAQAREQAKGSPIELWNGPQLKEKVRKYLT